MQKEDYDDLYALEDTFWWFAGMRTITAAILDGYCQSDDLDILDAGCGTGLNLEWLGRYGRKDNIVGLDISPDALRRCRERGLGSLVKGSTTDQPFADGSFDLVTSFDVLVHLAGEATDERALGEMFRVLRPDGLLFVRVAAYGWMRSSHDAAINSHRRYTLSELRHKIEGAGFSMLHATYANALLFPLAIARRHVLQPLGIVGSGSDVKPLPSGLSWLNPVFAGALGAEAKWLNSPERRLPFGLSAICIARKS